MPGFNISRFRSQINQKGLQKPNKFLVTFAVPAGMRTGAAETTALVQNMEYWAEATQLPGVLLQMRQVLRYGHGNFEKKPFSPAFNDISMTVLCDGKMQNWSFFQRWIAFILNFEATGSNGPTRTRTQELHELSYKSEFATNVTVRLYADNGQQSIAVTFRDSFPIFLGDIPLNWADNNNFMRVPLTITFSDWYIDPVDSAFPTLPQFGSAPPAPQLTPF